MPDKDFLKNSADLVVLSVLAEGPRYGYAITKQVAAQSGGAMRLTAGVLYPLLHQMEQEGLLMSSWEIVQAMDHDDDDKGRKWYRLSAKGKKRLGQRITAHRAYQAMIDTFLPAKRMRADVKRFHDFQRLEEST